MMTLKTVYAELNVVTICKTISPIHRNVGLKDPILTSWYWYSMAGKCSYFYILIRSLRKHESQKGLFNSEWWMVWEFPDTKEVLVEVRPEWLLRGKWVFEIYRAVEFLHRKISSLPLFLPKISHCNLFSALRATVSFYFSGRR